MAKAKPAPESIPDGPEAEPAVTTPAAGPAPVLPDRLRLSTTLGAHSIARPDTTGSLESTVAAAPDGSIIVVKEHSDAAQLPRLLKAANKKCAVQVNPRISVQSLWRNRGKK